MWALLPASAQSVFALRSIGASTLFPAPSPNRRRSVQSRSPSPPPLRLDPEALLRQRNQLLAFSIAMFAAIFVWRVWWAPVVEGDPGASRAYAEHGLSAYPTAGMPPPAPQPQPAPPPVGPWPPTRTDAASALAWGGLMVPITLAGHGDAWAAAPTALHLRDARGVALLFHGCSHTAAVWATGGAPERALVAALLRARLLPVALTSADSRSSSSGGGGSGPGCWDAGTATLGAGSDNAAVRASVAALAAHWEAERRRDGGSGGGRTPSSTG